MSVKSLPAFLSSNWSSSSASEVVLESLQAPHVRCAKILVILYVVWDVVVYNIAATVVPIQAQALRALESAVASLCECEQYLELALCLNNMAGGEFKGVPVIDSTAARRQKAATKIAKRKYKAAIASWQVAQRRLPMLPTFEDGGVQDVSTVRLVLFGRVAATVAAQRCHLDSSYHNVVHLRDATTTAMLVLRSQRLGWSVSGAKVSPRTTSIVERSYYGAL